MPLDDALDQGQAHAGPFEFILAVQPLKDAKELVGVPGIEPGTVVLDIINVLFGLGLTADFHQGVFPMSGEFDGVGQQIHKHLAHQRRVAPGRRQRFNVQLGSSFAREGRQLLEDRIGQRSHVQHGRGHLLAAQSGEVQQFINQSAHAVCFALDDSRDAFAFRADFVPVILHQNLGITGDAAERRAQVVGHRVGEGFQLFVDQLQLGGPFGDASFEFRVQPANLLFRPPAFGDVARNF